MPDVNFNLSLPEGSDADAIKSDLEAFIALGNLAAVKAGRRNSKADQDRMQQMHDHTADLGAFCHDHNCPADETSQERRGKAPAVKPAKPTKSVDGDPENEPVEASDSAEELGIPLDVMVNAVRESFWDLRSTLRRANRPAGLPEYEYYPYDDTLYPNCEAVYDGYAIAKVGLAYYKVPYVVAKEGVTLAEQPLWQQVTQEWVSKSADLVALMNKNARNRDIGAVKALGAGRLGNYLVVWGDDKNRDLYGEWFTEKTAGLKAIFDVIGKIPALYQHAMDGGTKYTPVGVIDTMEADEIGLWTETQLDLSNQYAVAVQKLARKKALGSSSGALPGSRKVDPRGEIKEWAIIEGSFTPTPAEPRLRELGVEEVKSIYAEAGIEFPEEISLKSGNGTEEVRSDDNEAELESERLAILALELNA